MGKDRKKHTSKYKKLYGMTITEMIKKHGKTHQAYVGLHSRGRLQTFLDDPVEFERKRYFKNDTKYKREYGLTGKELCSLLGFSSHSTLYDLDRAGLLHLCINHARSVS